MSDEVDFSLDELWREMEWRKCKGPSDPFDVDGQVAAFVYFCETYWKIRHPKRGRIAFELYDDQKDAVRHWITDDRSIVLKARQIGYSTLAGAYAFWCIFFWGDRNIIMLSKGEREAVKLLNKAKYGWRFIPQWLKDRGPKVSGVRKQFTETKMEFDNESCIESLPSNNDPARGESVWLVILDELAFLPNPDEAWASVEPITDVGGSVIALSTANGEGNIFYDLWCGAEQGTNGFVKMFYPWWSNGRDQAWYDQKKRSLPDWQLWQEYPSNADEAFIRSGRPVFNIDKLHAIQTVQPARGDLVALTTHDDIGWVEDEHYGNLLVWAQPLPEVAYVIGADVAEGLDHGDFSSAHVMSASTGQVVAHWHGHIDPDLFGSDILARLGWWYNTALIAPERNNHGYTTITALQRVNYPKLYTQKRTGHTTLKDTDLLGWLTTRPSKAQIIDELSKNLRDNLFDLRCERTIAEMRRFSRNPNGSMEGTPHDDRVMSLAIANWMRQFAFDPEYALTRVPPEFSVAWFRMMEKEIEPESFRIGQFSRR